MARAQWGKGKHQVLVLKDEILKLFSEGENLESAYQKLTAENKLTIGNRTFYRHARTILQKSSAPVSQGKSNNTTLRVPVFSAQQPATFNHSPTVDNDAVDAIWNGRSDSTHTQLKTTEDTTP